MESILSQIFTSDYNRTSFEDNVLKPVFLNSVKDFVLYDEDGEQEVELSETEKRTAKKVVKYGEFKTHDNRNIDLYEVTVQDFSQVKIARVGLGAIVKKLIIGNNAVFATFKYENVQNKRWRFSFIAYDSFFEEGQVKTKETNPKRYTYVFGDEDETYRTAIDRFVELDNKFQIKIKDIQDAFAVEAMSDEFFELYRKTHYSNFVQYLTGEKIQDKGKKSELVWVHDPNPLLKQVFNYGKEYENDDEFEIVKKRGRDFCKKLLGQIVFLYFLQKKGWLGNKSIDYKEEDGDKEFLHKFFDQAGKGKDFYPKYLHNLFYNTLNERRADDDFQMPNGKTIKIPYLNGGLFEPDSFSLDKLNFPQELFSDLFDFFNRYNFTIYENSPEEHTIAVDPEMLGHIFENLLEDNRDKGAFYTPKDIVRYMTQESLIEYLITNTNDIDDVKIRHFVKTKKSEELTSQQLIMLDSLLSKVKVCDPAIGSGAFPMGVLQEVFSLKEHIAFKNPLIDWNPATVKQNIIQNSIYGVDIEKGAVDIAQLRFWLSLIVDEDKPRALPNLDYKIMQGNSLVESFAGIDLSDIMEVEEEYVKEQTTMDFGNDFKTGVTLFDKISKEEFKSLLDKFFAPEAWLKQTGEKIDKQVAKKQINQFIEGKIHARIFKKKKTLESGINDFNKKYDVINSNDLENLNKKSREYKNYTRQKEELKNLDEVEEQLIAFQHTDERPYFLWHLFFADVMDAGGFDIVIGNPPYIKEYTSKEAFDGFRNSDYYQGKMDLWYGFACISIDLLKENGVECFIAQNNWITSAGASKFRDKVLQETKIKLFTDFWNYKVFKSAGIQTMIYLLKKEIPDTSYSLKYSLLKDDTLKESELENFLNFDNEAGIDEKYILDFDSTLYYDSLITFNNPRIDNVLNAILERNIDYLSTNEIAQGIVYPQDKLNKKNADKLGEGFNLNDGIFQLNESELKSLNLNEDEYSIVKPFYSTTELNKYFGDRFNKEWILYTKSDIKYNIESYPNIKEHLNKYSEVITSDNKPYGLHRARNEEFFKGEKIISLRKNYQPCFTYTDFDCYVTQTFYSIKTDRFDLKYLTALLNSKLIAFWLRFKGKMQGNNYQIDKEPLVNVPIIQPENIDTFKALTDYLIYLHNPENKDILSHTENKRIATHIEDVIDMMIYELYFENHMKENGLDVLQFVNAQSIENLDDAKKIEIIKNFYMWYQKPENEIRQRILLIETRSKDTLAVIRKSVN